MQTMLCRRVVFAALLAVTGTARATDFTDYTWTSTPCVAIRPTELVLQICGPDACDSPFASFVAPLPGTFTLDMHYEVVGAPSDVAVWVGSFNFSSWCAPNPCSGDVLGIEVPVEAGGTFGIAVQWGWDPYCYPGRGTTCTFTNLQFHAEVGIQVLNGGVSAAQLFNYDPGEEGTGSFVSGLAELGDVNGDGHDDWACGLQDGGEPYGSGLVRILSGSDGSVLHEIKDPAFHEFGAAVADVGDLDGDGADDVAVTEAKWPGPSWQQALGRVHVFSGATADPLFVLDGTQLLGGFGSDIDGVGDIDGDGVGDILVGASAEDGPMGTDAGCVRIYSGATQAVLFEAHGDNPDASLGADVAGTGDVDGDALTDFVACAPGDPAAKGPGLVLVWSGAGPVLHEFTGFTKTEPFAHTAGAGDVNADGFADILIGSPKAGGPGMNAYGIVRVRSGPTGGELLMVGGGEAFEQLGAAISRAGDLDGDGFGDVLAAAPGWHDKGRVVAMPGHGGTPLFQFSPHVDDLLIGYKLAGAHDLDSDGTPDILVSSFYRVLGDSGVPAENVVPLLQIEGSLEGGSPLSLSLTQGPPGGAAALVFGLAITPTPFKGGLLVPSVDRILPGLALAPNGSLELQTVWPPGLTSLVVVQAWMATDMATQGFVASDAVVLGPP